MRAPLRPRPRLLVPVSRRRPVRPLTRLQRGAAQPRHAAPLVPWQVDRWIRWAGWVCVALLAAWATGLLGWLAMWGGTWTVATAFMVAAAVAR